MKEIQGAPAGRVKGSSQGSSLEPLRIRERRDSHGQKPPTRGDPGSRIFFIFLIFLIFSFFGLFEKHQKNQKMLLIFGFFWVFRKKSKKSKKKKNEKGAPAGRVKGSSQGSSLEPLRIRERKDSHGQKPPTRGDAGSRIFFIVFDFSVLWPFRKNQKIIDFFDFLVFEKNQKTKNEKNPGCSCREGLGLQPGLQAGRTQEKPETLPPRGDPGCRICLIHLIFFGRTRVFNCSASAASLHVKPARTYRKHLLASLSTRRDSFLPLSGARAPDHFLLLFNTSKRAYDQKRTELFQTSNLDKRSLVPPAAFKAKRSPLPHPLKQAENSIQVTLGKRRQLPSRRTLLCLSVEEEIHWQERTELH